MDVSSGRNLRSDSACFNGILLAALSYGALLMLYSQLTRVLVSRPKRGRVFWAIASYSAVLFPLTTVAIGGKFKFAELTYVVNNAYPGGSQAFYKAHSGDMVNVMSQISTTLLPWIGDLLMLYRILLLWSYRWWILLIPVPIFLSRVAMSIPLLISETRPNDLNWAERSRIYGTAFYALCVSLNLFFTFLISIRLLMLRRPVERVMGRLHASFYTSSITIFVESGAFFTIWSFCYLVSRARNSWVQDIFLQPYSYILAITRMLIILRMAQNRAWSKDMVTAIATGVLDWQVSSTNSVPLSEIPSSSLSPSSQKSLPKKFKDPAYL